MDCPCNDEGNAPHTSDECVNLQIAYAKGWRGFVKHPKDCTTLWKRGKWTARLSGGRIRMVPDELAPDKCWRMVEELCERFADLTIGVAEIVTEKKPFGKRLCFTSRNQRGYTSYRAAVGATWLELIGAGDDHTA